MAVIIRDEFTATDGTLINGRTPSPTNTPGGVWAVLQGAPTIVSDKFTRSGGVNALAYVPSGVSDGVFTCDFVVLSAASAIGIAFRVTDLANYWLCRINLAIGPTTLDIVEITGSAVVLHASTAHVYNVGTSYTITLTIAGAAMSATCDGATVAHSSAVRQLVQSHGVRLYSGGASADTADNFQISTAGNAVPVIMDYYRRRRAR